MSQPPAYSVSTNFAQEEAAATPGRSTLRTPALDGELANVETTIAAIRENLAILQRDDGELQDGRVKLHTLASDVLALVASGGFIVRGGWTTITDYALGDIVLQNDIVYLCMEAHASGTFATDLAANKWGAMTFIQAAVDTPFSQTVTITSSNVQQAIEELDTEVRPVQTLLVRETFNAL